MVAMYKIEVHCIFLNKFKFILLIMIIFKGYFLFGHIIIFLLQIYNKYTWNYSGIYMI